MQLLRVRVSILLCSLLTVLVTPSSSWAWNEVLLSGRFSSESASLDTDSSYVRFQDGVRVDRGQFLLRGAVGGIDLILRSAEYRVHSCAGANQARVCSGYFSRGVLSMAESVKGKTVSTSHIVSCQISPFSGFTNGGLYPSSGARIMCSLRSSEVFKLDLESGGSTVYPLFDLALSLPTRRTVTSRGIRFDGELTVR